MGQRRHAIIIVATVLALLVVPWQGQEDVNAQLAHQGHVATGENAFTLEMQRSMTRMTTDMHAAPATGDPDRDFLAMMIPHHEGAVEMARLLLLHGRDPLSRKLAEEIIAGQQTEITAMRDRLARMTRGVTAEQEYPSLSGTRGSN